jgi:hypothetical protein
MHAGNLALGLFLAGRGRSYEGERTPLDISRGEEEAQRRMSAGRSELEKERRVLTASWSIGRCGHTAGPCAWKICGCHNGTRGRLYIYAVR